VYFVHKIKDSLVSKQHMTIWTYAQAVSVDAYSKTEGENKENGEL